MPLSRPFTRAVWAVLAALALAPSALAVEPDPFLPRDADSVTVINLRQLFASTLVKNHAAKQLTDALEANEDVQVFSKVAGLNVTTDIDRVMIATTGGFDGKMLLVARGKYDVTKIETALADHATKNPKELTIGKEGTTTIYESNRGSTKTFAAFADAKTLVASPDRAYLTAALKRPSGPVRKELADALGKLSGEESAYLVLVVTPEVKKSLESVEETKELAKTLKVLSGGVLVTEALQIDVTVTTTTAMNAQQLAQALNTIKAALPSLVKNAGNAQFLPLAEAIRNDAKVANQGTSVTLNLKLGESVIKKAFEK